MPSVPLFVQSLAIGGGAAVGLAVLLTVLPRLGRPGRAFADVCSQAPTLDLVLALLTWIPWIVAGALAGWAAVGGVIVGQVVALYVWIAGHEVTHRQAVRGPRIIRFINGLVGRWRNHAALWVTMVAFPTFWIIRITQIIAYPFLIWLLGFPRYRHRDWINVSRHHFENLVGHDLIWCLYCDWMTGVYALGAEMLRNVESFWCPIRFYDGKKCENCALDFPDVNGGWVPADGTLGDVEAVMSRMYTADGPRSWFGHPARITIDGAAPGSAADQDRATDDEAHRGGPRGTAE